MNLRMIVFFSMSLLAPSFGQGATINVSEVTEVAADGRCSLLEAVVNAEADRNIHPDCTAGTGADTLVLFPDFQYELQAPWPGTDSGLPVIGSELQILGNSAVIRRATGAPRFRLLEILGGPVVIENVTLRGGLSDNLMIGGGGIRVSAAALTLREVTMIDNRSLGTFVFGGALRMEDAVVLIEDSHIVDNTALGTNPEHGGGAIAQFNGELTIRRSALLDNWADVPCDPAMPDAAATTGGALRIEASSDSGAQAYISDSTIAGNLARVGGGIHLVAIADTGVAGIQDVFVSVLRSTIVFNQAIGCGGLPGLGDGIHVQEANGGQGLVAFGNTILHGNGRALMGDRVGIDCSANSPNASFFPVEGSVLDDDDQCPSFGFDAFAGNVTSVIHPVRNDDHYVPLANGPAVDLPEAGVNCAPVLDQIGNPRAGGPGQGGDLCDSGAIEFQPIGLVFTLDVTLAGDGSGSVLSTPAGIDCPGNCSADFDDGVPVALSAVPDVDQTFTGWSGACSGTGGCTVTMDQARSVTATFAEPSSYPLTVFTLGVGSVSSTPTGIDCPEICEASFETGSLVQLNAIPATGYAFDGWGGACGGDGPCQVTMGGSRAVVANFVPLSTLSVTVNGSGSVSSTPMGIDCPDSACTAGFLAAEKVVLQPQSLAGAAFLGWSGDCSGTGPCVVAMENDRQVTANFEDPGFELRVVLVGEGSGQVFDLPQGAVIDCPGTCSAVLPAGTAVSLGTAVGADSRFQGFGGDCQGDVCSLTMNSDRMVRAVFLSEDQLFLDSFE